MEYKKRLQESHHSCIKLALATPICMTGDARRIKKANEDKSAQTAESAHKVKQQAVAQVRHEGGDHNDETFHLDFNLNH